MGLFLSEACARSSSWVRWCHVTTKIDAKCTPLTDPYRDHKGHISEKFRASVAKQVLLCSLSTAPEMESAAVNSNDSSIHHHSAAMLSEQMLLFSFVLLISHSPTLCWPMPLGWRPQQWGTQCQPLNLKSVLPPCKVLRFHPRIWPHVFYVHHHFAHVVAEPCVLDQGSIACKVKLANMPLLCLTHMVLFNVGLPRFAMLPQRSSEFKVCF